MARVVEQGFGEHQGQPVRTFELINNGGMVARVATYGATLLELWVPDSAGKRGDVVLGFDTVEEYAAHGWFFGATVGRVANRIGDARFAFDGKEYPLFANNGPHHLHGGRRGWDKVLWSVEDAAANVNRASVTFIHRSPAGDEGYPGAVEAKTTYTLDEANVLSVVMEANVDAPTLVNMAHHTYWNLSAGESPTILEHRLKLNASMYTPAVENVPRGEVAPVAGTPFDFTRLREIGQLFPELTNTPRGYDHNWVVDGEATTLREVAQLVDPVTERSMTLFANQPGVQFYTGNYIDGSLTGRGGKLIQHAGMCLETQAFPNAVNVPAWQSQVIVRPGTQYRHEMQHRFSW
jgi:aldose 1-epimerase